MSKNVYIEGNILDVSCYDVDIASNPIMKKSKLNESYQDGVNYWLRFKQKGTPHIIKTFKYDSIDGIIDILTEVCKLKGVYKETEITKLRNGLQEAE